MFRPALASRRVLLRAMSGIVLGSPPGSGDAAIGAGYCPTPGRDYLDALESTVGRPCGECKWHAMHGARRAIDSGQHWLVELCMTVSPDPEEHVFYRLDGQEIRDDAVAAGMPRREVGDFVAEAVWRAAR